MKRIVSQGSEKIYKTENVSLLLWIYDNDGIKELLLEELFCVKLDDAQVKDIRKKQIPVMRQVCKVALQAAIYFSKNRPIILTLLTYNVFSHYLKKRRK